VTRYLDVRGIHYEVHTIPDTKLSAVEVAKLLGVPADQVYKTIVVIRKGTGKPILAVVPGPRDVDLKALARYLGEKRVILASEREAEKITSLRAGGISPLALLKSGFLVIIDESALEQRNIHISGGQRGMNIRLLAADLIQVTGAKTAKIST
jgi:Cys-tRNA(Pro)/Cys-tRNA(Cys) deacylase